MPSGLKTYLLNTRMKEQMTLEKRRDKVIGFEGMVENAIPGSLAPPSADATSPPLEGSTARTGQAGKATCQVGNWEALAPAGP